MGWRASQGGAAGAARTGQRRVRARGGGVTARAPPPAPIMCFESALSSRRCAPQPACVEGLSTAWPASVDGFFLQWSCSRARQLLFCFLFLSLLCFDGSMSVVGCHLVSCRCFLSCCAVASCCCPFARRAVDRLRGLCAGHAARPSRRLDERGKAPTPSAVPHAPAAPAGPSRRPTAALHPPPAPRWGCGGCTGPPLRQPRAPPPSPPARPPPPQRRRRWSAAGRTPSGNTCTATRKVSPTARPCGRQRPPTGCCRQGGLHQVSRRRNQHPHARGGQGPIGRHRGRVTA